MTEVLSEGLAPSRDLVRRSDYSKQAVDSFGIGVVSLAGVGAGGIQNQHGKGGPLQVRQAVGDAGRQDAGRRGCGASGPGRRTGALRRRAGALFKLAAGLVPAHSQLTQSRSRHSKRGAGRAQPGALFACRSRAGRRRFERGRRMEGLGRDSDLAAVVERHEGVRRVLLPPAARGGAGVRTPAPRGARGRRVSRWVVGSDGGAAG